MTIKESTSRERFFSNLRVRRLLYLIYGIFFINYAFIAWGLVGYLDIIALVLIWIILILAFIFVLYSVYEGDDSRYVKYLSFAAFALSFALFIDIMIRFAPAYGTDEIAIDTYASYLFVHRKDPYINANMVNVFTVTGFPKSLITPLLKGGAVQFLIYPGLAVLLFIPTVLLHVPSYSILLFFNLLAFVVVYLYYRNTQFTFAAPALAVAMIVNMEYAVFSISGVTDIVWVTFVAIAYFFRKKPWISGLMFGLAVSFKQTPLLILPFFLFFLYNENDLRKDAVYKFLLAGILAFAITNAPFILANAYDWAVNIAEVAFQPIIGVGIGPSITSFAGFLYVPSIVFTIISISLLFIFFVLYVENYSKLRFAFFTFPIVVFLFNFRVLENYLIFWPFLIFLVLPDISRSIQTHKETQKTSRFVFFSGLTGGRKIAAVILVLLIAGGGAASAGYEITHDVSRAPFSIMNVTGGANPLNAPGDITMLTISMNYTPLEGSSLNATPLYRIFPNAQLNNVNSLLWSSSSYLEPGINNLSIYPDTASDFLPQNTTFRIEAYYGNYSSYFTVSKPIPVRNNLPFADPSLIYPTYSGSQPYPGWSIKVSGTYFYSYRYLPDGINFTLTKDLAPRSRSNYVYMTTGINFTYLADQGALYTYNYSGDYSTLNLSAGVSNFSFSNFSGVLLSFDNGYENYWIGYSKVINGTYFRMINRTTMMQVTNQNIINFRTLMDNLNKYNWSYDNSMFSFVVGTSGNVANITGEFYNATLSVGSGASSSLEASGQSNAVQSFAASFYMEDKRW
ncbi:MAG: glycosyltransferase 87 family protein [Candidatus Thermoplasmatota archaeon]|nr:glycosyltransferase 87 family protein [Candidatus Thermoplasmatota archaeon]